MKLEQNAITVLERRYLTRDENGTIIESVEDLFWRVANAVASADQVFDPAADEKKVAQEFFTMMTNLEFLPNSPTLMNAGKELGQLAACFVLPVDDSMEAIFEAVKQAALIHKSGGGTGFSFSRLRSNGSTVSSTGGVASGPVSFMRVFNMATEAVKQGGTRRGANMGILRVDHPDILEFIACKQNNKDITNFNISVGITEAFMEAVEADQEYSLVDPRTKRIVGTLSAREVFEKIVHGAWENGEPGIVFLDRLNRDNMVPSQGEIESTNPCGEQPLLPYEACNLGSINMLEMLRQTDGRWEVDYDKFRQTIQKAVHFLDNVIEINRYPLPIIAETTKKTRKIGLGIMGFADMLLRLNIAYNSAEGIRIGEEIMEFLNREGHLASQNLAGTRGAFPLFAESTLPQDTPLRNATVTTIAPTGTLSILAGCSSGVEPVFAYAYIRNVMDGTKMVEGNPILKETLEQRGLYSEELMEKIIAEGTLAHILELPEDLRSTFVCAHDISPLYHIQMQAAFQKHTDNAVSKTVNFPHDATEEEVAEVYKLAWKLGCKGTTIYRNGSREGQVLNIGSADQPKESVQLFGPIKPRKRPESLMGMTKRMKIGCGNLYVTVNYDEQGICEVFTSTGKASGCPSQSEATSRLLSIALRAGVDSKDLLRQIRGIRCPSTIRQPGMKCTSCPDAIARVIEEVYQKIGNSPVNACINEEAAPEAPSKASKEVYCPECGEKVLHEGGCVICRHCGYSKCN